MHSRTQHSDPQVIKASLQQQTPIRKVAGNQLAAILMSTPFTFERLGLNVSTLDDCHLITVSFAPFLIWTKAELAERIAPVMGVASKCRLFNIFFVQRGYGRHVWMWRKFATVKHDKACSTWLLHWLWAWPLVLPQSPNFREEPIHFGIAFRRTTCREDVFIQCHFQLSCLWCLSCHQGLCIDDLFHPGDPHAARMSFKCSKWGWWSTCALQHHQQTASSGLLIGLHLRSAPSSARPFGSGARSKEPHEQSIRLLRSHARARWIFTGRVGSQNCLEQMHVEKVAIIAISFLIRVNRSVLDMLKRVLQLHDVKTFHFSQHQHVTLSEACLEDFSRHVSRFPDVVRFSVDDADLDPEALPLGFTGPLQPLKRHPVIRSKQDDFSSDEVGWKGVN